MQSTQPKRPRIRWRRILAPISILYVILCVWLAHSYLHPKRFKSLLRPPSIKEVMVPSAMGPVPSWASPGLASGNGKPIVFVLAHGYGGDRSFWTDPMLGLMKRGFESVAPSMPGQDASPDDTVGFGVKEAVMIIDTVKWVRRQYKKPPKIVLWGVSMGGAAAWLASEQDPTVDAVVTEGAYSRFDEAMNRMLNERTPGASIFLLPMVWLASFEAKIDPSSIIPLNSAAKWKKSALVIQGAEDKLIPMKHAEQLASAAHCPLWVVPYAPHAQCFDVARKEYLDRLTALAKKL